MALRNLRRQRSRYLYIVTIHHDINVLKCSTMTNRKKDPKFGIFDY